MRNVWWEGAARVSGALTLLLTALTFAGQMPSYTLGYTLLLPPAIMLFVATFNARLVKHSQPNP